MPVTDLQVAALRAQLSGHLADHKALFSRIDWEHNGAGYAALLDGAFFEAVDRRFNDSTTQEDIVAYVADVRSRTEEAAERVNPDYAERLISIALGRGGSFDDLDEKPATTARLFLLVSLTIDQEYDDDGLDEFLREARKNADHLLG